MELKTELKIIRRVMVAVIISGVFGIGVLFFPDTSSDASNKVTLDTKIAVSGFGEITLFNPEKVNLFSTNIYQDIQLGFQVSKPSNDWTIHSASDDMDTFEISSLKSKGYLGGIYLEKEHDKKILITVFDIQKENFQLNEYIENQITIMNSKQNSKIIINQVSKLNDWAIFSADMGTTDENRYGEQLLYFFDGKFYMLQYSGNSPENLSSLEKSNYKLIMNSFEVI